MISNIKIENFKCFKDATFPFSKITVITGGNGAGKSSVIQSLLLMRQAGDAARRIQERGRAISPADDISVRLNGSYELALGNSTSVTNSELESEHIRLTLNGSASSVPRSCAVSFEASSTEAHTTVPFRDETKTFRSLLTEPAISLFTPEFHYLVAERVGPRELYNVVDQEFVNTGFRGEATANAIARVDSDAVTPALQLASQSPLFKVQLELWMQRIVPHVQLSTALYPEINKVRIGIRRDDSAAPIMTPSNTGFGISYSLPIVVSGLLAKPGGMFIVENPEAHLHPSAQSAMGYFLARVASAGVQVIIETHSEHIVNGVRIAVLEGAALPTDVQLLYLSARSGDTQPDIEVIQVDHFAELTRWPSGFFDQQGADLARMFKMRRSSKTTRT